ncbi:cell envelope-related function transcriptional attenuator common domain-containing protein [Carnobacterium viridans]|uniref:Cell envelope-related function transcriptional attenuator common domain-containing protein n=2 Tax=Carnobacterium viridans TaxID=174587 RepID=A0A1H0YH63_9LACT|nr:cell envelope-related function transcriptional attenuator common domain-containing protein [Carnobacterium viridans]
MTVYKDCQEKGERMSQSRSEMRENPRKKKRKKGKGLKIFLIIILVLFIALGLFVWKIYSDVAGTTEKIHKDVETEEVRESSIDISKKDPFSILMLGVDTGDLGRTEQGRSDTMMVMTVNPTTNKATMVSIPRDTRTEIIGHGTTDKVNHAYAFGGTAMSVNTVQSMLDIPIDYYVEVNMKGLQDIVDAVGGVQVTSPLTFTYEGYNFTEGESTSLDGKTALAYSRMRYDDPNGDYGRQERQRQVIQATLEKVASLSTISNYQNILGSLENNMQTNLEFNDMVKIFNNYRSAAGNIEQVQLEAEGTTIDGIYYGIVSDQEMSRVSGLLKEQLELN